MERTKDPIIGFRMVKVGKDSKGRDKFDLYVGGEKEKGNHALQTLVDCLTAQLSNPKGAKLTIHIGDKEYEGRTFKSAFAFAKGVQEFGAGAGAGATTVQQNPDTSSKILQVKNSLGS